MFSYLRSHHKRTGSNPSSPDTPLPPHGHLIDSNSIPSPGFFEHPRLYQYEEQTQYADWQEPELDPEPVSITPVSPLPPVLPPIPRVASVRKGATSPTKRESFGINFDRTSLSLGRQIVESQRQDSPVVQEVQSAEKHPTWSYGQSAYPTVPQEPVRRPQTRGDEGVSAVPMQKQPSMASKASTNSQASSGRSQKYDGHTSFVGGASRPNLRLDGQTSMAGGVPRQEHWNYDEQQARMFQRMERPQILSNGRPHTAGVPAGLRPIREPNEQAPYSPVTHHGLQRPVPGLALPMSTTIEDMPRMPAPTEQVSFSTATPVAPQPTVPAMSPGFLSVAYDSARSRTPPTKHNAPGRPASPAQLPTVKSRSKLNLRNPMSLLLRRRSGHNLDELQLADESLLLSINNRSEMPDDYDPRIKGTKVHDFNAPRPPPKRVFTSPPTAQASGADSTQNTNDDRVDSPRPKRAHTPTAFVELFDDDNPSANGQGVRAEELANKDFVKRNSRELLGPDSVLPLPPFARKQQGTPPEYDPSDGPVAVTTVEDHDGVGMAVLPQVELTPTPPPKDGGSIMPTPEDKMRIVQTHSPSGLPPQLSPPKGRHRKSLGLPKHLDSRSSRFSFQLGGPEAQLEEKILEERHKAKQAEKAMQAKMTEDEEEYDEDYYDNGYDEADMYGEEPIPGMEDEEPMDGPLSSFSLGSRNMSMTSYDSGIKGPEVFATAEQLPSSAEPPKLEEENPLGTVDVVAAARMALSSNPPSPATYSPNSVDARSVRFPSNASARPSVDRGRSSHEGSFRARFEDGHSSSHSRTREVLPSTQEHPEGMSAQLCEEDEEDEEDGAYDTTAPITEALGDDMYFDDGMIEDPGDEEDVVHFNEEAFDDPSSQLYERRPINEPVPGQQNFVTAAAMPANGIAHGHHASVEQADETKRVTSLESNARPFSGTSQQQYRDSIRKSHLSEFTNLEAYHSALAHAATQAAAEGRFARKLRSASEADHNTLTTRYSDSSMESEPPIRPSTLDSSGQSLVRDDQRTSNSSSFQSVGQRSSSESAKPEDPALTSGTLPVNLGGHARMSSSLGFDASSFDFGIQSDLDGYGDDDDPIIAAANAEALANDDDGEYGREFGFYAAPPPLAHMIHTHLRSGDSSSVSGSEDGSEVEYVNGGFFGPKGINTVERSKSLREPNLTPITERSEFSTRNSCISLFGLHSSGGPGATGLTPASAGPLPSPGLAHLARMSPYPSEHDEMSMENLMKLRRGAFGDGRGSSTSDLSNAGSSSPRNSSPIAQPSVYMLPRHSQLQHANHAAAVGWLNGVGVGLPSTEGLERLGEDDESSDESSDEDEIEGDAADDYHVFDDGDGSYSPMPDSPTIIASDEQGLASSSSPATAPPQKPAGMYQQRNSAFQNLTLITTSTSASPPPPQPMAFNPSTPRSALAAAAPSSPSAHAHTPATVRRRTTAPHPPSSPSPMSRPQQHQQREQGSGKRSVPHSPAHSRNSSRNEEGVSVAYVREKDEEGGGQRWVLEKRRMSEVGELVVVGREVVTGGRI